MPRAIALIYLCVGVLWILIGDRLVEWSDPSPVSAVRLHTLKAWAFVLGSSLLVYWLLRRYEKRNEAAMQALFDSGEDVRKATAELEQRVAERTRQLEAANRELESFAYAVSHDLRAPLRSLSGFSQLLTESSPPGLDEQSRHYLRRIQDASQRMSRLIEDLLGLSRISRAELVKRAVNLSELCEEAAATLRERCPNHTVELTIAPGMIVEADPRLLRIAMDNLLSNAWKYSSPRPQPKVEVGVQMQKETQQPVYFVRDNGVGFDMAYAGKLFTPFQRLHAEAEFPGAGVGLVTVQRILARHGGRIWAEAQPDQGAVFYFTLGS